MPLLERLPLTDATRQWDVWGTTARLVVTDPRRADEARRIVEERLDAVDEACSRFRDDSELAVAQRRRQRAPERPVLLSPLLAELVDAALRSARETGGAVDPTLADDLAALGYDRDLAEIELRTTRGPVRTTLTRRIRHDWRQIRLDGLRLEMPPGVHLDLGASGKAHAADLAARRVEQRLGCGVLVALGGDVATAGPAPERGWQVLVRDGDGQPATQVGLQGGAIATSSTLSRRWRHGTTAVHHILDPASGRPADPVWRTVTVAAPTCREANARSTAAIVAGAGAEAELRATGRPARLVRRSGEVVRVNDWPEDSR